MSIFDGNNPNSWGMGNNNGWGTNAGGGWGTGGQQQVPYNIQMVQRTVSIAQQLLFENQNQVSEIVARNLISSITPDGSKNNMENIHSMMTAVFSNLRNNGIDPVGPNGVRPEDIARALLPWLQTSAVSISQQMLQQQQQQSGWGANAGGGWGTQPQNGGWGMGGQPQNAFSSMFDEAHTVPNWKRAEQQQQASGFQEPSSAAHAFYNVPNQNTTQTQERPMPQQAQQEQQSAGINPTTIVRSKTVIAKDNFNSVFLTNDAYVKNDPVQLTLQDSSHVNVFELIVPHVNNAESAVEKFERIIPERIRQNKYAATVVYEDIRVVPISTRRYIGIAKRIRESLAGSTDILLDLPNILNSIDMPKSMYDAIETEFLSRINNRLIRVFRSEQHIFSFVELEELNDLVLVGNGSVNSPLMNIPDRRDILTQNVDAVIEEMFMDDMKIAGYFFVEKFKGKISDVPEIDQATREGLEYIIACPDIDLNVNGITKYSLAFCTESEKAAWFSEFFDQYTILIARRTTIVSNTLQSEDLVSDIIVPGTNVNYTPNQATFWAAYQSLEESGTHPHLDAFFVVGDGQPIVRRLYVEDSASLRPYLLRQNNVDAKYLSA